MKNDHASHLEVGCTLPFIVLGGFQSSQPKKLEGVPLFSSMKRMKSYVFRCMALLGCSFLIGVCCGCHNQVSLKTSPMPFARVQEQPDRSPRAADMPAPSFAGVLQIDSPLPGTRVPQFGETVRIRLNGPLPARSVLCLFVRDATGLESNWWALRPHQVGDSDVWQTPVQFGERGDSGRTFAVIGLMLPEERMDAIRPVGNLPSGALAQSGVVEVQRE